MTEAQTLKGLKVRQDSCAPFAHVRLPSQALQTVLQMATGSGVCSDGMLASALRPQPWPPRSARRTERWEGPHACFSAATTTSCLHLLFVGWLRGCRGTKGATIAEAETSGAARSRRGCRPAAHDLHRLEAGEGRLMLLMMRTDPASAGPQWRICMIKLPRRLSAWCAVGFRLA